ncbi:MAG: L-glutamate gamma-semialdehyde dehydrogenase [Flavobacteriaceae bacterium]|nr:L-glutamate gamma-semialdehyde dehydrogenase [Flavobacteriaceae bacterium]
MSNGIFKVPTPINEPVKAYLPGSPERQSLLATYEKMYGETIEVPLYIGAKEIKTSQKATMSPPHDHRHILGHYYLAQPEHIHEAIENALSNRKRWSDLPWQERASIFLKAADLVAGPYRDRINAATMLGQSKTVHQAEIDAACELADFLRFNVSYMTDIYADQPISSEGIWNRLEYRALEGFVYAITPFNFTAIAGNLPSSAAMMGNVVVWKPSDSQVYSAKVIIDIFKEAGLPDGIINVVFGDPKMITDIILEHQDFAGIHFTGSTQVFKSLWAQIGANIHKYKNYPRIVGETGGKDFILAHPTSHTAEVVAGIIRGAFEFQGQKCSAASRVYLPKSKWTETKDLLLSELKTVKMGSPQDPSNFVTAVIHQGSFDKLVSFIEQAKSDKEVEIIAGGGYDKSKGYFIEPTVLLTTNPKYTTMCTELFGPVVTLYLYDDKDWDKTLELVNTSSEYALTGAIFCRDRYVTAHAIEALRDAAGNFYINDKPTGAVVGQQPFGGARASGTNDKAGSVLNLLRWVSPRTVKETFLTPKSYRYPFLG